MFVKFTEVNTQDLSEILSAIEKEGLFTFFKPDTTESNFADFCFQRSSKEYFLTIKDNQLKMEINKLELFGYEVKDGEIKNYIVVISDQTTLDKVVEKINSWRGGLIAAGLYVRMVD